MCESDEMSFWTPRVASSSGRASSDAVEVVHDALCAIGKSFLSRLLVLVSALLAVAEGWALLLVEWWEELEDLTVLLDAGVEDAFALVRCVEVDTTAVLETADETAAVPKVLVATEAETLGALQVLRRRCVGAAETETRAKARTARRVLKACMMRAG